MFYPWLFLKHLFIRFSGRPFLKEISLIDTVVRLVFSRFLDLPGNLGIGKENWLEKLVFLWKEAPSSTHLPSKILPGGVWSQRNLYYIFMRTSIFEKV